MCRSECEAVQSASTSIKTSRSATSIKPHVLYSKHNKPPFFTRPLPFITMLFSNQFKYLDNRGNIILLLSSPRAAFYLFSAVTKLFLPQQFPFSYKLYPFIDFV